MNDNEKINAAFDPRDGDPHHISAYDYDAAFTWTEIAGVVLVLAIISIAVYLAA